MKDSTKRKIRSILNSEEFLYIVGALVIIGLCVGISFLCIRCTQTQMDGGMVLDKRIEEAHYVPRVHYNSETKTTSTTLSYIPAQYILIVQKTIDGKLKVKEVEVSITKYYSTEIGEIYNK